MARRPVVPGIVGVVASAVGVFFAAFSTHDYANHLDRQLHQTHCSFTPGLSAVEKGENACKAAMYSPYSALFRDRLWGGIPISLFALGAYGLFFALALYLLVARDAASKREWQAYGIAALTPLPVTGIMFTLSLLHLDAFCKLCVGLYTASLLLAVSGVLALIYAGGSSKSDIDTSATMADPNLPWGLREKRGAGETVPEKSARRPPTSGVPVGSALAIPSFLFAVGLFAAVPAAVYAASVGDYRTYVLACGKIGDTTEKHGAFVKIPTSHPVQAALTFEDPLCPTCRAFHQRLVAEGVYDKLDLNVAIFPLDADRNFLLTNDSVHPGTCVVAKAFLCADKDGKSRQVLEWSYDNQDELTAAGKQSKDAIRAKVRARFPDLDKCIDAKETQQRLDHILQFAVDQKLRVMTPQLYLGDTHVCDEDTDLGLTYALRQIAPKVLQ